MPNRVGAGLLAVGALVAVAALLGATWWYTSPRSPSSASSEREQSPEASYQPGGSKCGQKELSALPVESAQAELERCAQLREDHRIEQATLTQQTRANDLAERSLKLAARQARSDFVQTLATVAAFVAAALAAFIAWRAAIWAKAAAIHTEAGAKEAKRSADLAEGALLVVERAYVFGGVDNIQTDPETGVVSADVTLLNAGKTPARVRTLRLGVAGAGSDGAIRLPETADYSQAEIYSTDTILAAGENGRVVDLKTLPTFGVIYGQVEYDDLFKSSHYSRFCLAYSGLETRSSTFGNESWNEYD